MASQKAAVRRPSRDRSSSAKPIMSEFGQACGLISARRSKRLSSLSCGFDWASSVSIAAVERDTPMWQWTSRWPSADSPFPHLVAEAQDGLHMLRCRQDHAGNRVDDVVKAQDRSVVALISFERLRIGMIRIEDRENVGHGPLARVRQFRDAADRQHLDGRRLHRFSRSKARMGREPYRILREVNSLCRGMDRGRSKYCVLQTTARRCHISATRDPPCRHCRGYVSSEVPPRLRKRRRMKPKTRKCRLPN